MKKAFLFTAIGLSLLASCGANDSKSKGHNKLIYSNCTYYGTLKMISEKEVYFNYQGILFRYIEGKTKVSYLLGANSPDKFVDGTYVGATLTFGTTNWVDAYEPFSAYLNGKIGTVLLTEITLLSYPPDYNASLDK